MVMLLYGVFSYVLFSIELSCVLGCSQVVDHIIRIDAGLYAKIYCRVVLRIEYVVALFLSIMHSEFLLNVFDQRMHLKAQIATFHSVKEVESDRKFITESSVDILS